MHATCMSPSNNYTGRPCSSGSFDVPSHACVQGLDMVDQILNGHWTRDVMSLDSMIYILRIGLHQLYIVQIMLM
ncbi:hypothetical protein Syun_016782 [Stephania yunnanensis]|uniref:Uncharacterized protein n=1 Tax=Stephania yunnanensis TaxID=152371 RepID=A0AAP0J6N5_9MAGN